ncbi:MAG: hypothetical protein H0X37_01200 [Herpetosiphonaceae bacterium]|nr:hypothetical protein [Herpetosiphonaceae bacterium]
MAENKSSSLPQFESIQELTDFFDTHDMGEYVEHMAEAAFDVDIKRRHYLVAIDADLMKKVVAIAKTQHVSAEALITHWLQEQAREAA